jgi:hypothetical protein
MKRLFKNRQTPHISTFILQFFKEKKSQPKLVQTYRAQIQIGKLVYSRFFSKLFLVSNWALDGLKKVFLRLQNILNC